MNRLLAVEEQVPESLCRQKKDYSQLAAVLASCHTPAPIMPLQTLDPDLHQQLPSSGSCTEERLILWAKAALGR